MGLAGLLAASPAGAVDLLCPGSGATAAQDAAWVAIGSNAAHAKGDKIRPTGAPPPKAPASQVTILEGAPEEMGSLVPDNEGEPPKQGLYTLKWTLYPENKLPSWVVCEYEGQAPRWGQELPSGTKSCTVQWQAKPPLVKPIHCE
jgi:hypothetical protein